jgi:nucleoside-diphosphate-sugar epimerase
VEPVLETGVVEVRKIDIVYLTQDVAEIGTGLTEGELVVVEDRSRVRPERSEVLELLCDNTKSKSLLRWSPKFTFEEGIERTIDFYRNINIEDADRYHV